MSDMRFQTTLIMSTSALALALGVSSPAFAQDAPLPVCAEGQTENCATEPARPEEAAEAGAPAVDPSTGAVEGDAIVVTGTRINRPTLSSPVPVTSIGT